MTRPRGGYIGFNRVPAASAVNSAASGIWTLREAEALKRAGTWPTAFVGLDSIAGLQLWLDASDSATLFDATTGGSAVAADGTVARWEDKSGNARHFTQSTANKRPVLRNSVQNNLPGLELNGSKWMQGSYQFANAEFTVFCVVTNITGSYPAFLSESSGNSNGYLALGGDNNAKLAISQTGEATSSSNLSLSGAIAATFRSSGISGGNIVVSVFRNGTQANSTLNLSSVSSSGTIVVGASKGGTADFVSGNIAEIIIYNSALSDTERSAVEDYLIDKWGIT